MVTPIDKTHVVDNFITQLRDVRERLDQLERLACQIAEDGRLSLPGGIMLSQFLGLNAPPLVIIDTGAIHVWTSYHAVDTEAAAAIDNLDYIYGGADGDVIILKAYDSARTVTLRDGVGNFRLGIGNITLDHENDRATLQYCGSTDVWCEIGRANNG